MPGGRKIRVMVVDDSAAVREALSRLIASDPELEVVATASDPFVAAERLRTIVPDVITLDVEMPRMDGVSFLKRLMAQHPIPVVMCSSLVGEATKTLTEALAAGAVGIICKPKLGVTGFLEDARVEICETIKGAAKARLRPAKSMAVAPKLTADAVLPPATAQAMSRTTELVVAIGASTGGTEALRFLLDAFPLDMPPIVIVQHMPELFTRAFAARLDQSSRLTVREAQPGDRLLRGHALIAPGGRHLLVQRSGAVYSVDVRDGPLVCRHRPSVDVLFRSLARVAGPNAIGVIMTGMGDDGARGLLEVRSAGGRTLGQDEESCVVYGMPAEAKRMGGVEDEVPLERMPAAILRLASQHAQRA